MSDPTAAAPAAAPATPAAAPAATPTTQSTAAAPSPASAPTTTESTGDQSPAPVRDWATIRSEYSNGDEKIEKRLARYSSEKDVIDALIAAQNKIASGIKPGLGKDATAEEIAAFRKEMGVPDSPEAYEYDLPAGVDKENVDPEAIKDIAKRAHELNMTPAQLKATLDWHFAQEERQLNELRASDEATRKVNDDKLRQEWGSEYRLNVNLINAMLDGAPPGVKDQFWGARLADGSELSSNPDVLRWLATTAREINPVATVVPGASGNSAQVIEGELAGIQKLMGDRNSAYWKGPESAKMQERYRELIRVQEKLKR